MQFRISKAALATMETVNMLLFNESMINASDLGFLIEIK